MKPIILDCMCGAGGITRGYQEVGFFVVGVDIDPQPNYVGEQFIQADALELLRGLLAGANVAGGWGLRDLAGIHASCPCQAHTDLQKQNKRTYPELIEPTRELLKATGLPYVIENVEGAPLIDPVLICGVAIDGLRVIRHRLFEANFPLEGIDCPGVRNHPLVFTHDKRKSHYGKLDQDTSYVQVTGGGNCTVANKLDAMQVPWMTGREANEAVPPAYARHVGEQLMAYLESGEAPSPFADFKADEKTITAELCADVVAAVNKAVWEPATPSQPRPVRARLPALGLLRSSGSGPAMTLRTSQVETLRLAQRLGGEIRVWQCAEQLHADNWTALQQLQELEAAGFLREVSGLGSPLPSRLFDLTDAGKQELERHGQ